MTATELGRTEHFWAAGASVSATGWTQVSDGSEHADDLLTLLFEPAATSPPMPVQVTVRAGPTPTLATWLDAGYRMSGYEGSELGPGVQCVAEQRGEVGGQPVTVVAAYYLFVAGEESVLVSVDPTLAEVFALAFPGLHQLLGTLGVRRADGSDFRSRPLPGYTTVTTDTWSEVAGAQMWADTNEERTTDGDDH